MSSPPEAPQQQQQPAMPFGLAPPPSMRPSSHSPQPDLPVPNLQASMLGRTPSGQLPSVYWDRKMASDMSRSGDTRTQLFVGNLPFRIRWQDLKDLFRRSGTVLRADVALTPENRSKGFGTVLFAHDVDAYRAIEMFNGFNWQSRILEVRLDHQDPNGAIALSMAAQTQPVGVPLPGAQSWQQSMPAMLPPMPLGLHPSQQQHGSFHQMPPPPPPHAQGLPPHLMPHIAGQSISRPSSSASNAAGQGRASRAVSPQPHGKHPNYGVVMQDGLQQQHQARSDSSSPPHSQPHRLADITPQSFGATMAQSMMPMMPMMPNNALSYPMMSYYAQAQGPHPSQRASPLPPAAFAGRHLFVGNLPFNFQWQDLKDLFRQAGNILRADVTQGPDGRSRGFGTVLFASQDDAQTAVDMFNGYELRGRQLKVHFDKYASVGDLAASGAHNSSSSGSIPTAGSLDRARTSSDLPSYGMLNGLGPPPATRTFSPSSQLSGARERPSSSSLETSAPSERPSSRNFTAPLGTSSAPNVPTTGNGSRRASLSTEPRSGRQTPVHPPWASQSSGKQQQEEKTPERAGADPAEVEPLVQQQPPPHRPVPGPLQLSTMGMHGYSTGPAALMSPPAPMGTPGFHPFSPQTGRIAMTPSMPGFSFHPFPQTPPLVPHFLSPGLGPFSPPLGGGAFASQMPSYLNPAPGAPIHMQHMSDGQTPSLDHVMSGSYFNAVQPSSQDDLRASTRTQNGSKSAEASEAEAPSIAEPSYFPPVETLLPKRRNSNSALGSPATLSVTTPGGEDASPAKRSHSTVERSSGPALRMATEQMSQLGLESGGEDSALSMEDGPDPGLLGSSGGSSTSTSDNPSGNRRASLYENKRPAKDSNGLQEPEAVGTRRASFEDKAVKRKERVDFGKSIWS